jgi:hypothetical protein
MKFKQVVKTGKFHPSTIYNFIIDLDTGFSTARWWNKGLMYPDGYKYETAHQNEMELVYEDIPV